MSEKEIDLIRSVDSSIEKVRTKSLDVSFNELYDMYSSSELIIPLCHNRSRGTLRKVYNGLRGA